MVGTVSFAELYLRGRQTTAISASEVSYLALEGGGGKGNAYLGALFGLQQLGRLSSLKAVAGSSAGAITALTLALGMSPAETYSFMATTKFASFFDKPSSALPTPGQAYDPNTTQASKRKAVTAAWFAATLPIAPLRLLTSALRSVGKGPQAVSAAAVRPIVDAFFQVQDVNNALRAARLGGTYSGRSGKAGGSEATPSLPAVLVKQILDDLDDYLTSLSLDSGLFSGQAARDRFAALISERMSRIDVRSQSSRAGAVDGKAVTFGQLDDYCKAMGTPRLRVTGSEMCSLRSIIFSGETTKQFPVADAVRISMGLPVVYKPYYIRESRQGYPPCGVYVDGGVFSNLPLLAFENAELSSAIGVRLEIDKPTRVDGFLGLAAQIAKASLLAGESNVTEQRAARTMRLDTDPLGLFDFSSDPETLARVVARSHLTTMLFFGAEDKFQPVDIATGAVLPEGRAAKTAEASARADLEKSIELRRQRAGCVFEVAEDG